MSHSCCVANLAQPEQMAYDQARTQALNSLGIAELRFWNSEVSENLEGVLEAVWNQLHQAYQQALDDPRIPTAGTVLTQPDPA